jgi:hypothetical protein
MAQYTSLVRGPLIIPGRVLLTLGQQQVLKQLDRPIPASVSVNFLIDTGSGRSTVIPLVIAQLNPLSRGVARVATSLAVAETDLFWVRLEFPEAGLEPVPELAVARLALPTTLGPIHGVIGRDLLSRWEHLLYQGRRARLTIRDKPLLFWRWFARST